MINMPQPKGILSRKMDCLQWLLLAGVLLFCPACASVPGPSDVFHDSSRDFASVRTVALMPLTNLSRDTQAGDRVRDVFANMLMANSGIYVIPPGEVARGIGNAGIANPTSPTPEEVVKLCKVIK